jgi:uncharacterized protein
MILLDSNILLYATFDWFPEHVRAKAWLDDTLSDAMHVGLPWATSLSFARIASNPRVFQAPLSVGRAWKQVEFWLAQKNVFVPEPGERHADILGKWMGHIVKTAKAVPDAHLAALAVEHGLLLCSADRDFAKYPGLRWLNPLDEPSI